MMMLQLIEGENGLTEYEFVESEDFDYAGTYDERIQYSSYNYPTVKNASYPKDQQYFNVFVYGTLKSGHGNNNVLQQSSAEFIGPFNTKPVYRLYGGCIPYLLDMREMDKHTTDQPVSVKGEVWQVNRYGLLLLDNLEGAPYHYHRRVVELERWDSYNGVVQAYFATNPLSELNQFSGDSYPFPDYEDWIKNWSKTKAAIDLESDLENCSWLGD